LSAAYERFRSFRSCEALEAVLDYFLENPEAAADHQQCIYVEATWSLLNEFWDERMHSKLAALFVEWESGKPFGCQISFLPAIVDSIRRNDARGEVSRQFLSELLLSGRPLIHLWEAIAAIVTPDTAQWLLSQGESAQDLIRQLAFTAASPEVRRVLQVTLEELPEARKAYFREREAEQARREQEMARRVAEAKEVITGSSDFCAVLRAFGSLPPEQ